MGRNKDERTSSETNERKKIPGVDLDEDGHPEKEQMNLRDKLTIANKALYHNHFLRLSVTTNALLIESTSALCKSDVK